MVLCFNFTPKTDDKLQNDFELLVKKKFDTDTNLVFEMIIPKRILDYAQNLLKTMHINNNIIEKEIFYKSFVEDGPEDVSPPFQYEYNRPCILLNNKEYKLQAFRYNTEIFTNDYIVLKAN